jgi:ribosome biogenesis GTPase A
MAIQWFPGHMHLTRKAIGERIKEIDVVIEMLDARLPGSSANPMLKDLTSVKPALKVLNKQDLADPRHTPDWLAYYNAQPDTRAIALDKLDKAPARALVEVCRQLAPTRGISLAKPMRVLICGIPNVGKSTLINTLVGKKSAKAADEAGVTKTEARYVLEDGFYLYDTPGVLWPRIIVAQSGYNLAASGAVGRNAFDDAEVALELLGYLKLHYAEHLQERYKLALGLEALGVLPDEELLDAIGRKRGALLSGSRVDQQKAAEILITDLRIGALGRISLETPQEFDRWTAEGRQLDAQRAARKEAFAEAKKGPGSKSRHARW